MEHSALSLSRQDSAVSWLTKRGSGRVHTVLEGQSVADLTECLLNSTPDVFSAEHMHTLLCAELPVCAV